MLSTEDRLVSEEERTEGIEETSNIEENACHEPDISVQSCICCNYVETFNIPCTVLNDWFQTL